MTTVDTGDQRQDSRSLVVSVVASAVFVVLSLVWGLALDSQLIVFDGLYSFASVLLSALAVMALRTSRKGPDERYPWGREVWEPLTIIVKAVALGGLCVYALVVAVGDLLRGGREVSGVPAVIYAVLATVGGAAVTLYLRRRGRSDLVRAEAAEWLGDTLLSVGVLVGFVVAAVLQAAGRNDVAAYVDPAMVVLISALFLRIPAGLIAGGFREVLTMSPAPAVREQLQACVDEVGRRWALPEAFLRSSKVGGRVDVEVDFVVDGASRAQTVEEFDAVRADLYEALSRLGYEKSMMVAFTADRRWAL